MDIDDVLVWGSSIFFSDEHKNSIVQNDNKVKIVAKFDYESKDNLAALKVYDSIVLIDVDGIKENISNKWVEINCDFIRLSSVNL